MRRVSLLFVFVAVFLLLVPAVGNAQEDNPPSFVYATYFECDVSKQERADDIVKSAYAPVYDAAVEDGTLLSWGWMAHHTGGKWRRVLYYSAAGLDALIDAPMSITPKIAEKNPSAGQAFSEICGPHVDYIWEVGTGSRGAGVISTERGKVGMSVYFHCDMGDQDRADEIVEEVFAPVFNSHVKEGGLASWGWLKHRVGGKWRRAATYTATDVKTLLATRGAMMAEINKKSEAAGKEFSEICGSHQDYIWNVVHEKP